MDPLSITAGAIAVIGALGQAAKCIQRLRAIRQAPHELNSLLEEVIDLNALLEQIQSDQQARNDNNPLHASTASRRPPTGLAWHVERTSSKLNDLDSLIDHYAAQTSRSKFDRAHLGWIRGRQKASTLCEELKVIRLNLTASLGATTSSAVERVELAIERSNSQQAETQRLLSTLVTGLALVLPSLNPPPFEYKAEDGSLNCNFNIPVQFSQEKQSTAPHPPKAAKRMTRHQQQADVKSSGPNQAMQIYAKKSKVLCKTLCSCVCHQKKVLRAKQPFSTAVGSFSLAFSGLPWITSPCDQKSCGSRSVPSVAMTIQFPAWFWKRYLSSSFTYAPIRGPEINIKLPRTIDWTAKLWKYGVDGNQGAIQDLFSTGVASPWDVSPLGGNILHYAAGHGHFKLCKFLVGEGAQTQIEDDFNKSPTELAWEQVFSGSLTEEEEYLVASTFTDADFLQTRQFTVLHKIVLKFIPKSLQSELEYSTKDLDAIDASGRTCVSWAAARGDETSLKTLLDYGANPNIPDVQGSMPLHHVKNVTCVKLLLRHGANLSARNSFGRNALHMVCREGNGSLELLAALAEAGIDVNATDHSGETPLMNATLNQYNHCARYLLDNDADLNVVNGSKGDHNAALHFATMFDVHETLRDLLARGANYTRPGDNDQTILHIAARLADAETIAIFKQHGLKNIDVSAVDNVGKTAKDYLNEREEDSANPDFYSNFVELLESIISSQNVDVQQAAHADYSTLAAQMAALDMTKNPTVTCLTPLSASDDEEEDEYYDQSFQVDHAGHNDLIFYDALEEVEHAPPVEITV